MKTYWRKRQEQLNQALEKDEVALKKRLSAYYKTEEEKLNRQIASYYANYGKDNVVEYRNLLQKLPEADFQLLMRNMDEFAAKYPEYKHLLPVRTSIYKLNRLEGLQYSVQMQQLEIGAKEQKEVERHLSELAKRSYRAVMETTGHVGGEWADIAKSIVHSNWTGQGDFSKTIWKNREKLSQVLRDEIASGFARGDNYQSLISQVRRKFKVSHDEAYRLIYTEGTFVMNEAKAKAIERTFEYYSIITAGDGKVCSRCQEAQDKTQTHPVKYADRIVGVNFPPFHPWCRCTEQIVIPDPQKWIDDYVIKHGGDPDTTEDQRKKAEEILSKFDASPLKSKNGNDTIKLKDTIIHKDVGAKFRNYKVVDKSTGVEYEFAPGTRIQNSEVFAGKGTKHPLHEGVAEGLTAEYGGSLSKWQHAKGNGVLLDAETGEEYPAEVHWFQEESVGKVKFKVKRWLDDES